MAKKKKIQAIKADVGDYTGVVHNGKEYRFGRDGTFSLSDEGLAREMEAIYGKKGTQKIAFTEHHDSETDEPGHRYTFGGFTSRQARRNYDRIFRTRK